MRQLRDGGEARPTYVWRVPELPPHPSMRTREVPQGPRPEGVRARTSRECAAHRSARPPVPLPLPAPPSSAVRMRKLRDLPSPEASNDTRTGYVRVRGAREHNLKNVDVEIPRDALVVFTGVSGSGKSSLAFGTLYAEAQRRYFESVAP